MVSGFESDTVGGWMMSKLMRESLNFYVSIIQPLTVSGCGGEGTRFTWCGAVATPTTASQSEHFLNISEPYWPMKVTASRYTQHDY